MTVQMAQIRLCVACTFQPGNPPVALRPLVCIRDPSPPRLSDDVDNAKAYDSTMREQTTAFSLLDFVQESNRIEGIYRPPTAEEVVAHQTFLTVGPTVASLTEFVSSVQPGARLRNEHGLDVVVGRYYPPPGGSHIECELERLLKNLTGPYWTHQEYEALHPFTDGNGRSGRVLWLWAMGGIDRAPLGFLHHWYYQSLQHFCLAQE